MLICAFIKTLLTLPVLGNTGEFLVKTDSSFNPNILLILCVVSTGAIRTTGPLDREKVAHYWLSVVATDLGTEPRASWTHVYVDVLDINDNAPELSQPIYFASVPENVEAVTSIVLVAASDADASSQGQLSFHITESHRTYFDVDHKTG